MKWIILLILTGCVVLYKSDNNQVEYKPDLKENIEILNRKDSTIFNDSIK